MKSVGQCITAQLGSATCEYYKTLAAAGVNLPSPLKLMLARIKQIEPDENCYGVKSSRNHGWDTVFFWLIFLVD